MARFDLSKYATVAERLAMMEAAWPDYRLETLDYSTKEDRANGIWRVEARLYLTGEDQAKDLPKATGHAFEVDSSHGPQSTSALEVCETSAVGRALALASSAWTGNKDDAAKSLASREEMEKAARGKPQVTISPEVPDGFVARVAGAEDTETLYRLWDEAVAGGFSTEVLKPFRARKDELEKVG